MTTSLRYRAMRRGMTLIEMLVVCVILMIVTAVTIPNFDAVVAPRRVRGRPIRIEDLLSHCRELAIQRGVRVHVEVDSSSLSASVRIPTVEHFEREGPVAIDTATEFMTAHPTFSCYASGVVQGPSIAVREGRVVRRVTIDPIVGRATEHR
jgi:prepilin-type N-terminal cleavage/methylation domain-containing protein